MTNPTRYTFAALGSDCTLHLYDRDCAAAVAVEAEIHRIENRYSRYRSDSILSQINRLASIGDTIEVDDETAALLDYAFACHRKSDGLFDITTGALRRAWNFSSGLRRRPSRLACLRWASTSFAGSDRYYPFVCPASKSISAESVKNMPPIERRQFVKKRELPPA